VVPRSHLRLTGFLFRQAWEDLPASLRTLSKFTVSLEEELSSRPHCLDIDIRAAPGELGVEEGICPWRSSERLTKGESDGRTQRRTARASPTD
jgi:hypothetical protein